MLIEEKFTVRAPVQKVWDFLMDVPAVSSCMPGVESVEVIDEKTYSGVIKAKVGFLSATFKTTVSITRMDPPFYLESVGKGEDTGRAGMLNSKNILQLASLSEAETEVSYRSETQVVGRLATLGETVMRGKAKQMGQQFATSLRSKLEEGELEEMATEAGDPCSPSGSWYSKMKDTLGNPFKRE